MHHLESLTNKNELKSLTKPCITQDLQNSIKKKNTVQSKIKFSNKSFRSFLSTKTITLS